jgi:O-methyltransferase
METNNLIKAKQLAYSTEETLMFTFECAKKMKDTEGIYVECGVAAGAQIIAMSEGAPDKTIYAFDSFDGIPLPSNKDDQMPGLKYLTEIEQGKLPNPGKQKLKSSGATVVALESFLDNISCVKNPSNIIPIKGWFEETLSKNETGAISILRLDGDLYNSTLVCLQILFPKVIKGGIVIIDDWELPGCQLACDDYFKSIGYKPNYQPISNTMYFINE